MDSLLRAELVEDRKHMLDVFLRSEDPDVLLMIHLIDLLLEVPEHSEWQS